MADIRRSPPLFGDDDDANGNDEDLFKTPIDIKSPPFQPEKSVKNHSAFEDEVPLFNSEGDKQQKGKPKTDNLPVQSEPLGVNPSSNSVNDSSGSGTPVSPDASLFKDTSSVVSAFGSEVSAVKAPQQAVRASGKQKDGELSPHDGNKYQISVTVTSPKKVGDGVGAYMVYKVVTKTNIPDFRNSEMEVYRRFSDFLGLHEKLVVKYLQQGFIIPPPPEKSVIGMTKVKMASEDTGSSDFVERRRAALERFINRVADHPDLQSDPSFVDFLEVDGDLPRATSTSALSGAGVMRLFNRVGDSIMKTTLKVDETDQAFDKNKSKSLNQFLSNTCNGFSLKWFEEKTLQLETLDLQLKMLQSSIDTLVIHRRELSANAGAFGKSASTLGTTEEHTSLSRALSQLAEVEEKVESVHAAQADADFYVLAELVHDYIGMVQAVKEALDERVKRYRMWKEQEVNLAKKREVKVRLELAHKTDKIADATREITECERRVERSQDEFEAISKGLRKELARFDRQRCRDFRSSIIVYLESLMNTQQQLIKHWELFLPEARAIV